MSPLSFSLNFTIIGLVSNIDAIYRTITIVKTKIAIDDVVDVEIKADLLNGDSL